MAFFSGLHEAEGLSVLTSMPPLGVRRSPLLEVQDFFKTHSPQNFGIQDVAKATAFLQASRRPLGLGLAAAGASEWLGGAPRSGARSHRATDCKAVCLIPGAGCNSHEDFLFGGQLPDSALTPKYSMMAGWGMAARMTFRGHPDDQLLEEENKGWGKWIPRALGFFSVVDLATAAIVYITRHFVCDVPLRTWLLGGILLGGPADLAVKALTWALKPRYKYFKLQVINAREQGGEAFEMESLLLYNEFGHQIAGPDFAIVDQIKEGSNWMVTTQYPQMISSYQVLTSQTMPPSTDPVTWNLLGSNNKKTWKLIDEQDHHDTNFIAQARNQACEMISDFTHQDDAAFRQAFLAELIATSTALGWLTVGSAWIAQGSETCVDSAPELWYYCFLMAVTTWSCLGTVTIGLIVSAVAMILLGVKTPA